MPGNEIRISKYLSDVGIASRREADRLIEAGKVSIMPKGSSQKVKVKLGEKMQDGDRVFFGEKEIISQNQEKIYLMLNKPQGLLCTADRRFGENVIDYVGLEQRVTYMGRLDKDSTGLLILTNDGELNNAIMRSRHGHEKEYAVTVNKTITEDFIKKMQKGVVISLPDKDHIEHSVRTRPCSVKKTGDKTFNITLTQGLNRQIRRMCKALGYKVTKLHRFRIGNLIMENLPNGSWRYLTKEETASLKQLAAEE